MFIEEEWRRGRILSRPKIGRVGNGAKGEFSPEQKGTGN
jgi:hypothetical protein